jgi:hypothetical protein
LKKAAEENGIVYRKGERSEAQKYNFKYIPHIVITDSSGKELLKFEATNLINSYKGGHLADTLLEKAKELSGK